MVTLGAVVAMVAGFLAGAMFWELSHDDGPLLDGLRAGLKPAKPPLQVDRH